MTAAAGTSDGPERPAPEGSAGPPLTAECDAPECSAKSCRRAATWQLIWNNPRLHTPEREKTWLACGDHRESLAQHLGVRGFLRRVEPFGDG